MSASTVAPDRNAWRLPPALSRVLARLPQFPPSTMLAAALNVTIAPVTDRETFAALDGRVVRIVVRDAGLMLTIRCRSGWFEPGFAPVKADATVSASMRDFALLAARKEDPDTLFFARRLTMEGDTEIGLRVKNMLDAADLSLLTAPLARMLQLADRLHRLAGTR